MGSVREPSPIQLNEAATITTTTMDGRESDESDAADIKVYVRFRPMNKLEISRRSKSCVEFHSGNSDINSSATQSKSGDNESENKDEERESSCAPIGNEFTSVTVDSPLEGEFQFDFDKV